MTVSPDSVDHARFAKARDDLKATYDQLRTTSEAVRQAIEKAPLPQPVLTLLERLRKTMVDTMLFWQPRLYDVQAAMGRRHYLVYEADLWNQREKARHDRYHGKLPAHWPSAQEASSVDLPPPFPVAPLPYAGQGGDPSTILWAGESGRTYRRQLATQRDAAQYLVDFSNEVLVLLRTARSSYNDLFSSLRTWLYTALTIHITMAMGIAALAMAIKGTGGLVALAAASWPLSPALALALASFLATVVTQVLTWLVNVEIIRKNRDTLDGVGESFRRKVLGLVGLVSPFPEGKWPDPTKTYGPVMGVNAAGQFRPITRSEQDERDGFRRAD